jgi:uncharacterized protein (DUF1800 family)
MSVCPPIGTPKRPVACRLREVQELQAHWLERLAFGQGRADDELVQLWLGLFPVSWRQLSDMRLLEAQITTIRAHLQGSYTDLLQAMIQDTALQISLNGLVNRRRNPNENFARELLELFTLGEGHFRERDVSETARALTGFRRGADGRLFLDPRQHDAGLKTILGRREPFEGASLAAWLCQQPATALNLVRRLWPRMVGVAPTGGQLEALAGRWRQQGLALPWLMQALRRSATAPANRGQRLEDPILMMVRSLRLLGSRHPDALLIARQHLGRMGQEPFDPPSVKGWPVNGEWINLRWQQARVRGLQALLSDEEVWASRRTPGTLVVGVTAIPPLTFTLPLAVSREAMGLLFTDPAWQFA